LTMMHFNVSLEPFNTVLPTILTMNLFAICRKFHFKEFKDKEKMEMASSSLYGINKEPGN
ncbi:5420_t:CDS:2, partial [Funneliformis mosseae]